MKKRKKSLKAKKNRVYSKKNKTAKKLHKKLSKFYSRKRRSKKNKKITMEDIYSIINKVQLGTKESSFSTSMEESTIIENVIRDVGIRYKKVMLQTKVNFILYPPENRYEDIDVIDHIDILDDEIPDEDQIFP